MSLENKKIRAEIILEVIGKPPEYLKETLENLAKSIEGEKGVQVIEKEINEPILMKDQKEFYTSFAELEIEVEEIINLAAIILKYMPSHVEIISPEIIHSTNAHWNDVLNETLIKLHGYDEIARVIQTEKMILEKKIRELMESKKNVEENEKSENKEVKKDDKPKRKNKD